MFGVAHSCDDPESIPFVGGIDRTSWNNKRPDGVALAFQIMEYLIQPKGNMAINIFENAPSGSFVCNNA